MKLNQLRIGNYIQIPYGDEEPWVREVESIQGDFAVTTNQRYCYDDEFDFAPLTEEWLIRFGFRSRNNPNNTPSFVWSINEKFSIIQDFFGSFYYYSSAGYNIRLQYLHQLQNLYYSITEQELIDK